MSIDENNEKPSRLNITLQPDDADCLREIKHKIEKETNERLSWPEAVRRCVQYTHESIL